MSFCVCVTLFFSLHFTANLCEKVLYSWCLHFTLSTEAALANGTSKLHVIKSGGHLSFNMFLNISLTLGTINHALLEIYSIYLFKIPFSQFFFFPICFFVLLILFYLVFGIFFVFQALC